MGKKRKTGRRGITISVVILPDQLRLLSEIAKRDYVSVSHIVRQCINYKLGLDADIISNKEK